MPAKPKRAKPRRPLDGVRIVDMSTVLMGPFATQILGDYGADVIKIEPPAGDVMRTGGPMRHPGMGSVYLQVNRNKRSVVLDVKKPGGRQAVLKLCEKADVFVHNIRPAAMRRLKLGAADVHAVNRRMVYVSLMGYGESGPYAGRPAYDDLIQGITGIPWLIGSIGSAEPRYVPLTIADRIVGLNAVHVILAALIERDRTGEGQAIEVPMFETMAQFVLVDHMAGRGFAPEMGPPGYSRLLAPDRRPLHTRDGYVCVLVYTDRQFEAFFRAIGRTSEFAADPRFADHATRARHYPEIYAILADIFRERTTAAWLKLLREADIPCVPLNDLDHLIDDPHLAEVGLFEEIEHPSEGKIRLAGIASRWSRAGPGIDRHPPRLGEHSVEVLREAGYSDAEISRLCREGAAVDAGGAADRAAELEEAKAPPL
jgi:crotonobetainyl-CoA:carnitine CoA-transferase CaiB-like acyl-CoA transferase